MKSKLILCLALVLSGGLFGCSTSKPTNLNTATLLQNALTKIDQQVPELKSIGMSTGISSLGQAWHGEEYASAEFVLRKNIRYHPAGEFSHETTPVPYVDIYITITRYASFDDAQKDLERGLRLRQATPEPKANYKGATLYKYRSGGGTVICEDGLYVVEINPNSEGASPIVMQVLDVVLTELDSKKLK
jgi:hypothetical protein